MHKSSFSEDEEQKVSKTEILKREREDQKQRRKREYKEVMKKLMKDTDNTKDDASLLVLFKKRVCFSFFRFVLFLSFPDVDPDQEQKGFLFFPCKEMYMGV